MPGFSLFEPSDGGAADKYSLALSEADAESAVVSENWASSMFSGLPGVLLEHCQIAYGPDKGYDIFRKLFPDSPLAMSASGLAHMLAGHREYPEGSALPAGPPIPVPAPLY